MRVLVADKFEQSGLDGLAGLGCEVSCEPGLKDQALAERVAGFQPDLVVAGELIEHTPDALGWISRLAACAPGADFLATTPNATSIVNLLMAFFGRENNHPDHLHVYSYKTLATLASRVPLARPSLTPYYYDPHLLLGRLPGLAGVAAGALDTLVLKPAQFLFPLTSFGWILEGRLGDGS